MRETVWIDAFDTALLQTYAITIEDTGWTGEELYARFGEFDPTSAVFAFGDKYGLKTMRG